MPSDISRIHSTYRPPQTATLREDKETLALLHTLTQKIEEIPPHIHRAGPRRVVEALREIEKDVVKHASQKQQLIIHAHIQKLIDQHY